MREEREQAAVVVLSPHRDDAAFSCGLLMTLCAERGTPVRVVNVFTRSEYAPYLSAERQDDRLEQVTAARLEEDRALVRRLRETSQAEVALEDLGLEDAPVRLSLPVERVLAKPLSAEEVRSEAQGIAQRLQSLVADDGALVFAPLGLGGHVDHEIVREAAVMAWPCERLALYEDLPYVARLPEEEKIHAIREALGGTAAAEPIVVPGDVDNGAERKRELAGLYPSQVDATVVNEMSDYAERAGGERFYPCAALEGRLHGLLRRG